MRQSTNRMPAPPPKHISPEPQTLDFTRRSYELRELLDEPCTYATYTAAMRSLARANRLTRGYTPILRFLECTLTRTGVSHEPLHVVDLGAGHGDLLRAALAWATKRSIPLRLTGVDMHPYSARFARTCDRAAHIEPSTITHLTADLFHAELPRPADLFLCSLVAHHLPDKQVIALLQKMATAREGFYLLDLRRSARAARIFTLLGAVFRWHPFVRHDGPVSFARAFSLEEWQALVVTAGIQATAHDIGSGRIAITGENSTYNSSHANAAARPSSTLRSTSR